MENLSRLNINSSSSSSISIEPTITLPLSKFFKTPKHHTRHKCLDYLSKFDIEVCAESLCCSSSHLRNVLYGYIKPSKVLNDKIHNLAIQLKDAERKKMQSEEGGLN
ncbi:MAG: hypothetical protein HQK72_17465 [Desulfamplus sp.]|nr:hypothetical protein [Desulfamplus sp.]